MFNLRKYDYIFLLGVILYYASLILPSGPQLHEGGQDTVAFVGIYRIVFYFQLAINELFELIRLNGEFDDFFIENILVLFSGVVLTIANVMMVFMPIFFLKKGLLKMRSIMVIISLILFFSIVTSCYILLDIYDYKINQFYIGTYVWFFSLIIAAFGGLSINRDRGHPLKVGSRE